MLVFNQLGFNIQCKQLFCISIYVILNAILFFIMFKNIRRAINRGIIYFVFCLRVDNQVVNNF